jgi:glycosyltransferase involved in cell wall biosynthesis
MNVAVFFTYNISLTEWIDLGIYNRETLLYKKISKKNDVKYTFLSYGTNEDLEVNKNFPFDIYPLYAKTKKSNNKIINFCKSLLLPFKIRKDLTHIDLLKTNQLNGAWVPILLKYLLKKPLVIRTGYDLLSFSMKEKKNIFRILFNYLLTQIALLTCDVYLVSSKADKKFLKRYFISTKKVRVSHNWIAPAAYSNFVDRDKNRVLSVGRLEKQKNFFGLIKCFQNSNFSVDIVGSGSLESELKTFAKDNNIDVNFLGSLEHEKLLKLYRQYRFFILFSEFEGNPKVLLEAMSRGCIPIVKKSKNIEEIITTHKNGILFESNGSEVVEIINNLNKDTKTLETLSKNIVKNTNLKYSIDGNQNFEISLYKELVKN